MNKKNYTSLKSGSDIRGTALAAEAACVSLSDEAVYDLTAGFCTWLGENGYNKNKKIAVGHDSRITAERIKTAVFKALTFCGYEIYDCSYASTPAMFMSTVDMDFVASIQITASHHPYDKNGLKFFTVNGGLDGSDISRIIEIASESRPYSDDVADVVPCDYMSVYAERLRKMICDGVNADNYSKPLDGYKIIVDAGNGVGGFYATEVLEPLGADITGSCFLEKDGMFPNHIPNPENKAAMESIRNATISSKADLGVIFDTDVDRAGCVDCFGNEINRNRLVALASIIALENNEGGTIVTDSVTSTGLTDFINNVLGGVHYRFRRGYKNVINEQIRLNNEGVNCPLAIETSGHAAFRENYYLDDGAYLVTKIIIKLAQLGKMGKNIDSLIEKLDEPVEEKELRFRILETDFRSYGESVISDLEKYAAGETGWRIADDNREGIRIYFDGENEKGWLLLRLSVHDPIMPLNIESNAEGGVNRIACRFKDFISGYSGLDIAPLMSI